MCTTWSNSTVEHYQNWLKTNWLNVTDIPFFYQDTYNILRWTGKPIFSAMDILGFHMEVSVIVNISILNLYLILESNKIILVK